MIEQKKNIALRDKHSCAADVLAKSIEDAAGLTASTVKIRSEFVKLMKTEANKSQRLAINSSYNETVEVRRQ